MFFYKILIFIFFFVVFYRFFVFLNRDFLLSYFTLSFLCAFLIVKIGGNYLLTREQTDALNSLIVGVSPDYVPFTFMENNEIQGFDVDLIQELGKRLNKKIVFKIIPFESLLPSIQVGLVDILASGLSACPNRAAILPMTIPYLKDSLVSIQLTKNCVEFENMESVLGVVNIGYTAEKYVDQCMKEKFSQILRVKSFSDALVMLKSSKAQVFVTAKNSFRELSDEFTVRDIAGAENYEALVLYVSQNKQSILVDINYHLEKMQEDGFIRKLKERWGMQ
jgi:ABC-type amino acid transport substrate-binding protein